jgi:hypothetical protein
MPLILCVYFTSRNSFRWVMCIAEFYHLMPCWAQTLGYCLGGLYAEIDLVKEEHPSVHWISS